MANRTLGWLKSHWLLIFSAVMILVGATYLLWPTTRDAVIRHNGEMRNAAILESAKISSLQNDSLHWGEPRTLELPRIGIKLDVRPGFYDTSTGKWTLDSRHAFSMQPTPGANLPTPVIYGHNRPEVFGKLTGTAAKELLRIEMTDGRSLNFRYVGNKIVAPSDASILSQQQANTVLLMTCTGAYFQDRRVMQFEYVGEAQ